MYPSGWRVRTRNGRADCSFCPPENPAAMRVYLSSKKWIFCCSVLSIFQNFRLNIWRVVRVVEGAALEILREAVRFVQPKPCNHADFTRFEKLNILPFFPSVLSKAFFYRKKAEKNGGWTYRERYRSGHNGPDSKSGSPHGLVGSNPTRSAIEISSNHAGFWIFLFLRPLQKSPGFGLFFP